jgi:hypothetical protein
MRNALAAAALAACLAGCSGTMGGAPGPSADVNNKVALCGAGFTGETMAKLQAAWQHNGGNVSAGFEQSARAAIFESVAKMNVKESDRGATAQALYDKYLGCVKS